MGIRVRIRPSAGISTVAGIDYRDLREIVVAAELHCYDSIEKAKAKRDAEGLAYAQGLLKAAKALDAAIMTGINTANGHPNGYRKDHLMPSEMTVAERRERVAEEKHERELFDRIFAEMRAAKPEASKKAPKAASV